MITFLMVARLLYDKGYREYVEAAAEIKRYNKNVQFQLMGGLDESNPQHVSKAQLEKDIQSGLIDYIGYNPNVELYMRASSCIVLPSYHEGMSRVLMEALAMQKPIITSRIPGCQEMVIDGVNGFLCEPKSTQSLVLAIKKFLLLSEVQRHEFGIEGRKLAERRFDIKSVIAVFQKITDSCVR